MENVLTPEQQSLVGTAVNFDLSVADPFATRTSYNTNGSFNEGDLMVIYRQYEVNGKFDWQSEIFRSYQYLYKTAPGTDVVLSRDWKVYVGKKKGDYEADGTSRKFVAGSYKNQTEADSLTWENGVTVRFRAWSRSNLVNSLTNSASTSDRNGKNYYYPDFCVSDWVTVSGPTSAIPMSLKHLGCRIGFYVRNGGNRILKVEIATEAEDYERDDNASDLSSDAADKFPKTMDDGSVMTAAQAAAAVKEAYEKMCMPAGVDIETGLLRGMTKAAYTATTDFRNIEDWEFDATKKSNLVEFGSKTSSQIANDVQHPIFAYNDSRYYLVTIPYDMSSNEGGEPIVLPSWTRFKIWLYDENKGDGVKEDPTEGSAPTYSESRYHILSLSDVKKDGKALYADGLSLMAGYSYMFNVGYRYEQLTITPDDHFSWEQQAQELGSATEDIQVTPQAKSFSWWKEAIDAAITDTKNNKNYNPKFHIQNEEQFLEFIKLVNGTAAQEAIANGPIYHLVKEYNISKDANGTEIKTPKTWGWSRNNDERRPQWVEKSTLERQGYVFYDHYHPSDANSEAYSEEDYLKGPFSFFDENLNRHFTVYLDKDLDFKDIKINSIGIKNIGTTGNPVPAAFKGYFDGYSKLSTDADSAVHVIKNLNVNGYYLFNYVSDAAIRNLKIESTHTVGLLNEAYPTINNSNNVVGWGCYITGISVKANNTKAEVNAIAHSLTGSSYVVGCIHEGDAAGPLVGEASDLKMYGCMRTASNISGAALLGSYLTTEPGYKDRFFKPQISFLQQKKDENFSKKPEWGVFMCNYYNKDRHEASKDALAMPAEAKQEKKDSPFRDDYSVLEYIRGCQSRILRAVYDNSLSRDVAFDKLTDQQIEEYYGLAPWKAMNYAIYKYNTDGGGKDHQCKAHYQVSDKGYDHLYPQLTSGKPALSATEAKEWNVLKQNN